MDVRPVATCVTAEATNLRLYQDWLHERSIRLLAYVLSMLKVRNHQVSM